MTSPELRLTAAVRRDLLAHARAARPAEACGVLVGTRSDEPDAPDAVHGTCRVENVAADTRTRYELDPEATASAIERAEAAGRDLVGFYHSHPRGPAEPSATDRRRAAWPGYVYCVVVPDPDSGGNGKGTVSGSVSGSGSASGTERGTIRAWRWTGDAFEPLDVAVVDG